jgi:3-hydroxyisobutyrate dehydrogenase-like beta-hydroxyacid dehydrogenase
MRDASPDAAGARPVALDLPGQAWFDVQLMHEDINLAPGAGRKSEVSLRAASAAGSVLSRAGKTGFGHRDIAGLFEVLAASRGRPQLSPAGAGPGAA